MSRRRAHIATADLPVVGHVLPGTAVVGGPVAPAHRVARADDPTVADLIEAPSAVGSR
ncbi:hypothetical protein [Streptomyces sp. MMG1121]|uniref:hypothetical protein n=1 Tax=Streptomyces sp. MMG1121 TaxID=1415544 RepID=UPI000A4662C2|nr:hypothetical protein [Streptomyces sp. MMG1121]